MDVISRAKLLLKMLGDQHESISYKTALLFSGGIDSSLLLSIYMDKIIPYTIGFPESQDISFSEKLCNEFSLNLNIIETGEEMVRKAFMKVIETDKNITFTDIGFETVFQIACDHVKQGKIMTGQGADEIFYGYMKFRDGRENSNRKSLEKLFTTTLPREMRIASSSGKTLITPYLDRNILDSFSVLPYEMHVSAEENKIIIREAARIAGLPDFIIHRPKKAAQYGSGINRFLKKELPRGNNR